MAEEQNENISLQNDISGIPISMMPEKITLDGIERIPMAMDGENYSVTPESLRLYILDGVGQSDCNFTGAEKNKLRDLPTMTQLTSALNAKAEASALPLKQDLLKSSEDVEVLGTELSLTDKAKLEMLVMRWNAATLGNGGFNWDTLLGSLNGIDDLTIEDMLLIMEEGRKSCCTPSTGIYSKPPIGNNCAIRTNVLVDGSDELRQNHPSMDNFCYNQIALEVFRIGQDSQFSFSPSNLSSSFTRCRKLREIKGWIMCDFISKEITCTRVFNECESLEEVRLCKLRNSIEMLSSPFLSLTSLQFLVEKAVNTTPITVSVHKDVYAKLTDESNTEWHKVLTDASEKNISFATIS